MNAAEQCLCLIDQAIQSVDRTRDAMLALILEVEREEERMELVPHHSE